jgi:hypothetical protein
MATEHLKCMQAKEVSKSNFLEESSEGQIDGKAEMGRVREDQRRSKKISCDCEARSFFDNHIQTRGICF